MRPPTPRLIVLCCAGLAAAAVEPSRADGCFQVVVHAASPATAMELSIKETSRIFLKKSWRWSDTTEIIPVDQPMDSPVRKQFSRGVHGKSASAIESYWQRMIFSGRGTPPRKMADDEQVLAFMRRQRGAIGYVSCAALPAPGVKAFILDDENARWVEDRRTAGLWPYAESPHRLLPGVIAKRSSLAETAAKSREQDVRLLLGGNCGSDGRMVLLHNREPRSVVVEVGHHVGIGSGAWYRTSRTYRLEPGGHRYLGCSNDGGLEHVFDLPADP